MQGKPVARGGGEKNSGEREHRWPQGKIGESRRDGARERPAGPSPPVPCEVTRHHFHTARRGILVSYERKRSALESFEVRKEK